MKLVVAPNALKGSLSPFEAATAIANGARRARPDAEVVEVPIADGGDGTAEVVGKARSADFREASALDPRGRPRRARYAWLEDGTAIIDVATASGLALLTENERSATLATSFGTGQVLRAALEAGAQRVVLGVGGSATVDGGAGVLQALGVRFLDDAGRELPPGGSALARLARIDSSGLTPLARHVPIEVACDVDSALLGEQGAARLFAPQKGGSASDVEDLERALTRLADVVERDFGRDVRTMTSGGAAGGIAAGLHGVLGARLMAGVDWVLDAVGFDQALAGAALCLTAEGQLDSQSLRNKGPWGVARRAAAHGVPVVVLGGSIGADVRTGDFADFTAWFSICQRPVLLEEALTHAATLLEAASEQVVRLFVAAATSAKPEPPESRA
ncbi:MAG: glycerate kinase [Polyangiaceae bacterium]|jgi:glycerate kinase|nr:glycerate kinase [Polyangiaceae bacterium]